MKVMAEVYTSWILCMSSSCVYSWILVLLKRLPMYIGELLFQHKLTYHRQVTMQTTALENEMCNTS